MKIITSDLENLDKYCDSIVESENIFPECLRNNHETIKEIVSGDRSITLVAFEDSKYIGNAIGCCLEKDEAEPELGLSFNKNIIYLFNFLIIPQYQGKGYGKKLFGNFITEAKKKGFTHVEGHFRNNGSAKIPISYGAKVVKIYKNWFNTGEDYTHCILSL